MIAKRLLEQAQLLECCATDIDCGDGGSGEVLSRMIGSVEQRGER